MSNRDFEPITPRKNKNCKPNDLGDFALDCGNNISFKIAGILFILYVILNTDVFIDNILKSFVGAVDEHGVILNKGIIISGVFLSISYIVLDFMNNNNMM